MWYPIPSSCQKARLLIVRACWFWNSIGRILAATERPLAWWRWPAFCLSLYKSLDSAQCYLGRKKIKKNLPWTKATVVTETWNNTGKVHARSLVEGEELVIMRNFDWKTIGVRSFQSNLTTLWCLASLWILQNTSNNFKTIYYLLSVVKLSLFFSESEMTL